jgi:hypothetical protein
MPSPYTLPILGASLIAAVVGGIHLGESAIGLINPIHFQGPAIHPRDRGAAIYESRIDSPEPAFASLYGWDEGNSARDLDCGGCEAIAARDAYAYAEPVRVYRGAESDWAAEPVVYYQEEKGVGGPEEEESGYDSDLKERVLRYAYYDVAAPEEPAEAVEPDEE